MMDASVLLPPTGTPLTGIDFVKRLPCGDVEKTRRVRPHAHLSSVHIKGTGHPKTQNTRFLLPVVLFISLDSFECELPSYGDFFLLSNIMGLNGARLVVLRTPTNISGNLAVCLSKKHDKSLLHTISHGPVLCITYQATHTKTIYNVFLVWEVRTYS